jgi:hypothetical protein
VSRVYIVYFRSLYCLQSIIRNEGVRELTILDFSCRTNLTEATRAMAKRTTEDVKKLASWPSESSSGVSILPSLCIHSSN